MQILRLWGFKYISRISESSVDLNNHNIQTLHGHNIHHLHPIDQFLLQPGASFAHWAESHHTSDVFEGFWAFTSGQFGAEPYSFSHNSSPEFMNNFTAPILFLVRATDDGFTWLCSTRETILENGVGVVEHNLELTHACVAARTWSQTRALVADNTELASCGKDAYCQAGRLFHDILPFTVVVCLLHGCHCLPKITCNAVVSRSRY